MESNYRFEQPPSLAQLLKSILIAGRDIGEVLPDIMIEPGRNWHLMFDTFLPPFFIALVGQALLDVTEAPSFPAKQELT